MIPVPVEILLAEDREPDILLVQNSFKKLKVLNHLNVVRDGEQLMDFLKHEGSYENSPTPDLILLDLNMPKLSGREALDLIKKDHNLRKIPVVVLTSSDAEEDIVKSYDLHANAYIRKPIGLKEFHQIIERIESFWFSIVTLPPHS